MSYRKYRYMESCESKSPLSSQHTKVEETFKPERIDFRFVHPLSEAKRIGYPLEEAERARYPDKKFITSQGEYPFEKALDDPKLSPVMNPKFNLRQVLNNMLLLEEHLQDRGKRCKDCCKKHTILIDALLSECLDIDREMECLELVNYLLKVFRPLEKKIILSLGDIDNNAKFMELAQELRMLRKILMQRDDVCLL